MLEKLTIEKGGANAAAIISSSYNAEQGTTIPLRTCTSLNTIVKQDHRGMKRITRPMLGFHFFTTAHHTLLVIQSKNSSSLAVSKECAELTLTI